ncbi:hypothetical protein [Wolbachia endosymbiont (group A) of Pherbina coryleti]|uniref:hypothetical protein n=1 Tax=Wolbachia endosymbiont (group A) of Pherbina coryleti TaxID=3066153 RepID=UPI0031332A67
MLLACYSHKHISYRIRTIIRKAIHSIPKLFLTNFKIIENTVEKACSCKTQHNGFSEKFSSILHFYSLSYNSPNAIRYVFMAIAGQ